MRHLNLPNSQTPADLLVGTGERPTLKGASGLLLVYLTQVCKWEKDFHSSQLKAGGNHLKQLSRKSPGLICPTVISSCSVQKLPEAWIPTRLGFKRHKFPSLGSSGKYSARFSASCEGCWDTTSVMLTCGEFANSSLRSGNMSTCPFPSLESHLTSLWYSSWT